MESMVEKQLPQNVKVIDREKTCPLLLRVFCGAGGRHNSISEFSHGNVPSNEVFFARFSIIARFLHISLIFSSKFTLGWTRVYESLQH